MSEGNPKKDLALIIQLTHKLGYDNNSADKLLNYVNKSSDFQSIYGRKYKERLENINENMITNDTCILCNNNYADNTIICKSCYTKLGTQLGLIKPDSPQDNNNLQHDNNIQPANNSQHDNNVQPANNSQEIVDVAATAAKTAADFTNKQMHLFAKKVNEMAGGEGEVELKFKDLFVNVFKHHSAEEAEEIFICGTKYTTPLKKDISTNWPRPWLYSRVAIVLFAAFYLLLLCWTGFKNPNVIPDIIFIGSLIMPLSVLVFFFEINAPRNISIFQTIMMFLVGGCASLLVTLILFELVPVGQLDFIGAILVGIIEELGKLIITVFFIKKTRCKYILNGLLVGSSIGAGFAAFESAGYAFRFFLQGLLGAGGSTAGYDKMMSVIYTRALLAPGGHVAWAGMAGAALMIVLAGNEYNKDALKSKRFISLFSLGVIMHAIWDMPIGNILKINFPIVPIILTVLAWIVIIVFIHLGLKELSQNNQNN